LRSEQMVMLAGGVTVTSGLTKTGTVVVAKPLPTQPVAETVWLTVRPTPRGEGGQTPEVLGLQLTKTL
jgi:hypothetical protein